MTMTSTTATTTVTELMTATTAAAKKYNSTSSEDEKRGYQPKKEQREREQLTKNHLRLDFYAIFISCLRDRPRSPPAHPPVTPCGPSVNLGTLGPGSGPRYACNE